MKTIGILAFVFALLALLGSLLPSTPDAKLETNNDC